MGALTDMTVSATANVRFELVRESGGQKHFEVVDGTMLYAVSGSQFRAFGSPCPYTFGPIEVPVVHTLGGGLTIDTTTSPATYHAFGQTRGDEIRVAEECDDLAFSTRPRAVWLYTVDADDLVVSEDGTHIPGTNSNDRSVWEWHLTRR